MRAACQRGTKVACWLERFFRKDSRVPRTAASTRAECDSGNETADSKNELPNDIGETGENESCEEKNKRTVKSDGRADAGEVWR
jgi:hypothetical protein